MSHLSFMIVVVLALATSVEAAFDVKVCFTVEGKPVSNALVKCYDEDWGTDDRVGPSGGAYTASNGCVTLRDTQSWTESPDIYCQVFPNGQCFGGATTKILTDWGARNANFGTVNLPFDQDYCGDFGIGANGCGPASFPSWLNDIATSVSGFANQCAAHDTCYSNCSVTQKQCDDQFLADMLAACASSWTCQILANLYYEAVDEFGAAACSAARTAKGCSAALCNA